MITKANDELKQKLKHDIEYTVRLITSSSYVTNRHLEQIVDDAHKRINKYPVQDQFMIYFYYNDAVFTFYKTTKNDLYERRFSYFFQAMAEAMIIRFQHDEAFLPMIIAELERYAKEDSAPVITILEQLSETFTEKQLGNLHKLLTTTIDHTQSSRTVSRLCSYIALKDDKEVTALAILLKRKETFTELELLPHFQLLKERSRWYTIKHWLESLFPSRDRQTFRPLQTYYDEMNAMLSSTPAEQEKVWKRWLASPNYERYLLYTKKYTNEEKTVLIEKLLPELELKLTERTSAKVYEQLLYESNQYERIAHYLLQFERDPFRLQNERKQLLKRLELHSPEHAKQVLHQFIIRLIEKKSRAHYEACVQYLKQLQAIYEKTDELERFTLYLQKLKKLYRTYRAFVEELKRFEL